MTIKRRNNSKYVLRGQGKSRRWQLRDKTDREEKSLYRKSPNKKLGRIEAGAGLATGVIAGGLTQFARKQHIDNKLYDSYIKRNSAKGNLARNKIGVTSKNVKKAAAAAESMAKNQKIIADNEAIIQRLTRTPLTPRVAGVAAGLTAAAVTGGAIYSLRNRRYKKAIAKKAIEYKSKPDEIERRWKRRSSY